MCQSRKRVRRGPGRPSRSENRDTRGEILIAAEKLFAATGYEATSLRQIANEASVDLATVKYHFSEKSTLYDQAYAVGLTHFLETFTPLIAALASSESRESLDCALKQIATACADFIHDKRNFVRMTLFRMLESGNGEPLSASLQKSELLKQLTEGIDQAVSSNIARKIDTPSFATLALVGIPMWVIATEPSTAAPAVEPKPLNEGHQRVERFVSNLLSSMVLPHAS